MRMSAVRTGTNEHRKQEVILRKKKFFIYVRVANRLMRRVIS